MNKPVLCELCGEPMPEGEESFKYHGYSGPCPKPYLAPAVEENKTAANSTQTVEQENKPDVSGEVEQQLRQQIDYLLWDELGIDINARPKVNNKLIAIIAQQTAAAERRGFIEGKLDTYRQVEDDYQKPAFKDIIVDLHNFWLKKRAELQSPPATEDK